MRSLARCALRLLTPMITSAMVVTLLWIAALRVFALSPIIAPPPSVVWDYLVLAPPAAAHRALVFGHLLTTLRDAGLGLVTGMSAATVAALALFLVPGLERTVLPVAILLRSVPLVAMAPLIMMIVGPGLGGVAVIGAIVVFFPALVNLVFGLRSAPNLAVDVVRAHGGGPVAVLRAVALPAAMPALFAAARIAGPGSIVGALIAEWLVTGQGTGGEIQRAIGAFRYTELWTSVAVLTATSILLYTIMSLLDTVTRAASS